MIRFARPDDIPVMQHVGAAAGQCFAQIDDPRIAACADDPPHPAEALAGWVSAARAWVAVGNRDDEVIGYIVVDVLDRNTHIEEVSVLPTFKGRGIGSALLDAAQSHAQRAGHPACTLTTFADVPWNQPWYERRGFVVMTPGEIGPELAARVQVEADDGLEPLLRVCMRRPT